MSPAGKTSDTGSTGSSAKSAVKRKGTDSILGSAGGEATKTMKGSTGESKKVVDCMALEELQSLKRSPESDSELYASNCANLRDILDQILKAKMSIKKAGDSAAKSKVQSEINELRIQFGLAFVNLKKLNRLDKLRTKRIRENTAGVMQRVDKFHLQLQNLRYEVMHLEKEVTKCLQFRSADEDVQLVPVQEFDAEAPQEVKDKVVAKGEDDSSSEEHRLRLARLEFEHLQRRQMHESLQKLNAEKRAYQRTILEKKSGLAGLKPQLAAILERTKSVQDYLDMPLDEERDQLALSRHLPHPLFVLFSEMRAYGHACDPKLKVEILGDVDEAATFNAAQRNQADANRTDANEEEDEDEDDMEEMDNTKKKKKKHGKKGEEDEDEDGHGKAKEDSEEAATPKGSSSGGASASQDDIEEIRKKLTTSHPLTVSVKLLDVLGGSGGDLQMVFSHLTQLRVVAVKVGIVSREGVSSDGGALMSPGTLLAHLMTDDDDGAHSPNPTTYYLLKRKLRSPNIPKGKLEEVGSAYIWAQSLAGLNFPQEFSEDGPMPVDEVKPDKAVCQTRVEAVVNAIRQRFLSRSALQKQVSLLESSKNLQLADLTLPPEVSVENLDVVGGSGNGGVGGIRSKVRAWSSVDYEAYASLPITEHLVSEGAVRKNDFFFRIQLNRDPANLIALVAVGPEYPQSPPVFCLNLHWNQVSWTVHNSEKVRALEMEINTCYHDLVMSRGGGRSKAALSSRYVLTLQIRRLMVLFDVLLESWNQAQVDSDGGVRMDFPREKLFLQPVRGRRRAPPLTYDRQLKIFTQ